LNKLILSDPSFPEQTPPKLTAAGLRFLIPSSIICCIIILFLPSSSFAEQMVTLLYVNGEKKGEVFVHRTESGDFLLRIEDFRDAGLREPTANIIQMEGEPHLSLRSISGVSFTFNEQTLTLQVNAQPSLLPRTFIEFASQPQRNVYYPKESSLFLNYGIEYRASEGVTFQSLNLTNELGIRRGDYLFLTDTIYTMDTIQDNFVRLHTSITRDDRQEMRRIVFGDLFASSGTLGSSINLGGISFSKVYGMNPYFITYPTLELSGQASLPSEVDIYVNGAKIRTERVAPGEFQLRNFSTYGGAGVVELVIRDSLGREQRFRYPFYASDNILLKKGLHDYSYNIGFLREEFGRESNQYSNPASVVFHRYGLTDFLTLGFRGEAAKDLINGGPQAAIRLGTLGVLNLSLSGSAGGGSGSAADVSYQYLDRRFNTRLFYQFFARTYRTLAPGFLGLQQNYATGAGLGYTYPKFGSLSFDLTAQKTYQGTEKRTAAIGYTKNFPNNVSLTTALRRIQDTLLGYSNEFFIGLTYTPKNDLIFSAHHESTSGREAESIQVQKNPPLGEGVGFRAILERDQNEGQASTSTVNSMLQYNSRHAILRGEMAAIQKSGKWTDQYQLGASGALVLLDGVVGLTRPVTDSFAAVKVGDIEGVMVRSGAQDMGKTDSSGRMFITNLNSYNDNLIAINDKDIPFEYYFPQVQKLVSPPLRSGSCIGFLIKKLQPITGILKIKINGEVKPVEFYEVDLAVDGREITFPTGTGGEFYIDISQSQEFKKLAVIEEKNCSSLAGETSAFLKPGTYRAAVMYEGSRHIFSLVVPNSKDPIIDLGQVVFDASPDTEKEPPVKEVPVPERREMEVPLARESAPKASAAAPETGAITPTVPAPAEKPAAHAPAATELPAPETGPMTSDSVQSVPEAAVQAAKGAVTPAPPGEEFSQPQAPSGELPVMEVHFRFGTAELTSDKDWEALISAVRLLQTIPDSRVIIDGHADQIGSYRYNLLLSKKRALTIAKVLRKLGVPDDKIKSISWFGKKRLICLSLDESCRKHNRRGAIQVVTGF
jgi:outer membrane usher protein